MKVARKELRKAFLTADMGISGANFAIAATGTLGIISNEGNARLTTTLPRVHVALVGVDKLVPDLHAALRILKILPPGATGQVITSYVSWITGANECRTAPGGKKEMHVVFLDNGRLALSRDPVFSQALRCVRCGACANVCPIYSLVGGHNYGHVYIGAIGLILTYFYHGRKNARAIVQNCLNCQACKAVCPAGIDLPHLIKEDLLRDLARRREAAPEKSAPAPGAQGPPPLPFPPAPGFPGPEAPGPGGRLHPAPALLFRQGARIPEPAGHCPDPLSGICGPKLYQKVDKPRYRVALFGGCLVDFVYPEQGDGLAEDS